MGGMEALKGQREDAYNLSLPLVFWGQACYTLPGNCTSKLDVMSKMLYSDLVYIKIKCSINKGGVSMISTELIDI
jgi:hypothetical protein